MWLLQSLPCLPFLVHLENGGSHPCKPTLSGAAAEFEQVSSSPLLPPTTNYAAVWDHSALLALPQPTTIARVAICDKEASHGQVACQPPFDAIADASPRRPHVATDVAEELLPSASRFGEDVVMTRKHVHNISPFCLCSAIQCVWGVPYQRALTCWDKMLVTVGRSCVVFRTDVFAYVRRRITRMHVCASLSEPWTCMLICIMIMVLTRAMTRSSACATIMADACTMISVHACVCGRRTCLMFHTDHDPLV